MSVGELLYVGRNLEFYEYWGRKVLENCSVVEVVWEVKEEEIVSCVICYRGVKLCLVVM